MKNSSTWGNTSARSHRLVSATSNAHGRCPKYSAANIDSHSFQNWLLQRHPCWLLSLLPLQRVKNVAMLLGSLSISDLETISQTMWELHWLPIQTFGSRTHLQRWWWLSQINKYTGADPGGAMRQLHPLLNNRDLLLACWVLSSPGT